jgi:hypothetical protein
MLALIDAGEGALEQAAKLLDQHGKDESLSAQVANVEILAPVPEPRQMRDGMSFPLHIQQAPRGQLKLAARAKGDMAELARIEAEPLGELPEVYRKQPIYYITNRFSVRGTNTTVKWPRYSQVMDYELEFGIITKNRGANISAANARRPHLRLHDLQRLLARDAQRVEMEGRLGPAKGRVLTAATCWGRGSSRPTRSAIPTSSRWKHASTARCARRASATACCFRSRTSSPMSPRTKR